MPINLKTTCQQCHSDEVEILLTVGQLENDEVFSSNCKNGHQTINFISVPRFSIFYDKGIQAYKAGNLFEAFSCFYTSLELFRIDFSKTYLTINCEMDLKDVDSLFKQHKFSERIYGIYASSYFSLVKELVDSKSDDFKISTNLVTMRNNFVHAGYIPTEEDVEKVGYDIYRHIQRGINKITNMNILEYYGVRANHYCVTNNISQQDIEDRKFVLYNHDLGPISINSSPSIDSLPTFQKILANY